MILRFLYLLTVLVSMYLVGCNNKVSDSFAFLALNSYIPVGNEIRPQYPFRINDIFFHQIECFSIFQFLLGICDCVFENV